MEKLNISKTLNADVDTFNTSAGHCASCPYKLEEDAVELFDNLEKLENYVVLVHIAGYVTRKDPVLQDELLHTTTFYHQRFGGYVDELDRGQLNIPSDSAVQWSIFCLIMFEAVKDTICRVSLTA